MEPPEVKSAVEYFYKQKINTAHVPNIDAFPSKLISIEEFLNTEDLAEITPEGNYNILGRANEVIILRGGANMFPYEIAEFIGRHEKVNDCYLYKVETGDERDTMPACVYSGDISPEHFYNYVTSKIEKYQVPVKFTRVKDTMPKLLKEEPGVKVNLFFMEDTLKENSEWVVDTYEG